jgi:enoyl-CoA hydratase/carnithine racemase
VSYEHLIVERGGHVATVTFNRPEVANALHHEHLAEIEHAALSFRDDAETRVVIFTGAGKHFSSGADLSAAANPSAGVGPKTPLVLARRKARMGERATLAIHKLDPITIAAWNGAAMGGGAVLATAMDFRVGADDCFMQYPEVEIGVNLQWQGLPLITRLVGPARAKRLVAGGERLHAPTLLEWGILEAVVPRAELLARAREMAHLYASRPPIAVQMIKRSVNALATAQDEAVMHMDFDQNLFGGRTGGVRTAIDAYLSQKDPEFTGD